MGARILPRRFDNFSGCSAMIAAARKKSAEKIIDDANPSKLNAALSISKLVLDVLGIARHGPIARWIATVKSKLKSFETFPASADSDPAFSAANSDRTGNPIAVMAKPMNAGTMFSPARNARKAGNMRFPAPKNIAKTVNESNMLFLFSAMEFIIPQY